MIRFFLVGLGALLLLGAAKTFADWRTKQAPIGESLNLPELSIEKLQSEDILGTASQAILERRKQADQDNQEAEPIAEPVENVQEQTETLIETIKQLPQDQVEAIKKQIYKDICEELMGEE